MRFSGAGAQTATLELMATADSEAEGPETFSIELGPDGAGTNGFDRTTLGTNVDGGANPHATANNFDVMVNNKAFPTVTISPGSTVTEGTAASFTVRANPTPTSNLTVNLTVEDAPNSDFVAPSHQGSGKTVTINANTSSKIYSVPTVGDNNDEPNGPITVTVNTSSDYAVGNPKTTTVTVNDNDPTTVTLAGTRVDVVEGNSRTFTVTLGRGLRRGESLTVPLTFAGTAERNTDYMTACPNPLPTGVTCGDLNNVNPGNNPRVNFTGPSTGTTATTVMLTLSAKMDSTAESGGEMVNIGLGTLSASGLGGGTTMADNLNTFSINDPGDKTLSLTGIPLNSDEGDSGDSSDKSFFVTLSSGTAKYTVCVNQNSKKKKDPATRGGMYPDYTWGPNDNRANCLSYQFRTSSNKPRSEEFTFKIIGDNNHEPNETIVVSLTTQSSDVSVLKSTFTYTIENDDDPPTPVVTIMRGTSPVTEGTAASFTVSRTGVTTSALTVLLAVSENTANGQDFVATDDEGNDSVAIPAGSRTVTYSVPTTGDSKDEPNGEVTVALRSSSDYTQGGTSSASVTVNDNDDPPVPVVTIARGTSPVTEGTAASFTVSRTGVTTSALTVLLAVSENTANGQDFVATGDEGNDSVAIPAGSRTVTYSVPTTGDSKDEPNGEVTVALRSSSDYTQGGASSTSVTVNDNDDPTPVVSISGGSPVTEGTAANFTVSASPAPTSNLTVNLTVEDAPGADFVASSNQGSGKTVIINANTSSKTYTVQTNPDNNDEPSGPVTVTVNDGTGYTVGSTKTASVTVNDNDPTPPGTPVVTITRRGSSGITEGGTVTFDLTANPNPSGSISVEVNVDDSGDFAGSGQGGSKTVTIGTGGNAPLTVTTVNDNNDEPNGNITATVAPVNPGSDYRVGTPAEARVRVNDNDPTTVTLAGTRVDVVEGNNKTFTVTLGRGLRSGESLTVPLTFSGTATRNTDYTTACPSSLPTGVACTDLNNVDPGNNPRVTFTGPPTGATARTVRLTINAATDSIAESGGETVDIGLGTLNVNSGTGLGGGARGTGNLAFRITDNAPTRPTPPSTNVGTTPPPPSGTTPSSPQDDDGSDDSPDDRQALGWLYDTAGGTGWIRAQNWKSDRPLGLWHGVTVEDGRVTELLLGENNLSGTIDEHIGNLKELKRLYLNDNQLTGTVPMEIGNLTELEELALWGNAGLGAIPEGFENMVDRAVLRTLKDVNGRSVLPSWFRQDDTVFDYSDWEGISADSDGRIIELDLSDIGLSGDITDAVSELSALEILDLSDNADLEGILPLGLWIRSLRHLTYAGRG